MAEEKNIVEEAIEKATEKREHEEAEKKADAMEETVEVEDQEEIEEVSAEDANEAKIAELTDRVARQMAEFDNFRKRSEKEKMERYEFGAKDIVEKILPIVDSFERGLAAVTEEEKETPFVDGMDKVYKQLLTALTDMKVEAIPAVGEAFDPELHNAVMHTEDENFGENTVAEEFQKGYKYKEHVVRHSMVRVAN